MDPILILMLGGVLLLGALISLVHELRRRQCPGCLSLNFDTKAATRGDLRQGIAYKVCARCGCTVEAGTLDRDGNVHWNAVGQRKTVPPEALDTTLRNTVEL